MFKNIASLEIIGRSPEGEEKIITFSVGEPMQVSEDEWRCSLSLNGLRPQLRDQSGSDAMQALCLSLSLGFFLLADLREKGWHLESDGAPLRFENYKINF